MGLITQSRLEKQASQVSPLMSEEEPAIEAETDAGRSQTRGDLEIIDLTIEDGGQQKETSHLTGIVIDLTNDGRPYIDLTSGDC